MAEQREQEKEKEQQCLAMSRGKHALLADANRSAPLSPAERTGTLSLGPVRSETSCPVPYGHSRQGWEQSGASLSEPTEVAFAELESGSLAELVEDPRDSSRCLLAVWRRGEIEYAEIVQDRGRLFVPLPRNRAVLRHVRLPSGAQPYGSVIKLWGEIRRLISLCVDLPEGGFLDFLTTFVLSTWLVDRLPVAPYVALVGLPQSGKTTLLKVLSLVCRRPLLTADITSAAFLETCSWLTPTLLLDEAGTPRDSRSLRHLLRMGSTQGVVAMRKGCTFHAFGAKVVCFLELPDDPALNSRFVVIPMKESKRTDLLSPTDPSLSEWVTVLQQAMLRFRFEHYHRIRPIVLPGTETLQPRARDLASSLAAVVGHEPEMCRFLVAFFQREDRVVREPLAPAQSAVLSTLFEIIHLRKSFICCEGRIRVSDLASQINAMLQRHGEHLRLTARKVGSTLTSLGFHNRHRTNQGWELDLMPSDAQRIHELVQTYGLERFSEAALGVSSRNCPRCKAAGIT